MNTPATTVFGAPLEPGERVVYFKRDEPGWQKPALIVVGILFSWAFIGLAFLAAGLMAKTTCHVVTTRRFLSVTAKKVEQIRHEEIVKVTKKIKDRELRWIDLERAPGKGWMSIQVAVNPGMVPLIERFAANPRAFDALPDVPFDVDTAPKPKALTA